MPDIEAEQHRDVPIVARGQEVVDLIHGGGLAGDREILDVDPGKPLVARHSGHAAQRVFELPPSGGAPLRVAPVAHCERAHVSADDGRAGGRRETDGPSIPGLPVVTNGGSRIEQDIGGVGGQTGEDRVKPEVLLLTDRPHRVRLRLQHVVGGTDVDQVERVLHEIETQLVSHDRRPLLWLWPALHREAGVDAESEDCHELLPSLACRDQPDASRCCLTPFLLSMVTSAPCNTPSA